MSSSTYGQDVENQVGTEGCLGSKTLEKTLLRSQRNIYDRAGQGCFLCLESPEEGHYAVMVPCIKPSTSRRIARRFKTPIYEKMKPWEMAYEADDEVWRRLVHACYQYRGKWKRFIPFYGITEVQEVTFGFAGVVERDGRYPIHVEWIELEDVKRQCLDKIEQHMKDCVDIYDRCLEGYAHSSQCSIAMEEWSQPCLRVEAERAKDRLQRLQLRHRLTDCALRPEKANGLFTFEGFAQEGCIYDVRGPGSVQVPQPFERYKHTAQLRGLKFVLGWHKRRIVREIPFRASCAWLGVAAIWLCVLFWRTGSGDWGIALGFAQVVAASISVLVGCISRH